MFNFLNYCPEMHKIRCINVTSLFFKESLILNLIFYWSLARLINTKHFTLNETSGCLCHSYVCEGCGSILAWTPACHWHCCGTNNCTFCQLITTFADKMTQIKFNVKYLFVVLAIGFYEMKHLVVRGTLSYNNYSKTLACNNKINASI